MNDAAALTAVLAEQVLPHCCALVEKEIVEADLERCYVSSDLLNSVPSRITSETLQVVLQSSA